MPRVAGIDIPENKRIEFSLRYIYGIGPTNVQRIISDSQIPAGKRAKDLNDEEIARIQKVIEAYKVEGDLRKEVAGNIGRLKDISTYRGIRHLRNLPARGQRTRTNARTKRGKRVTIGALKKEVAAKMEGDKAQGAKEEKK